MVLQPDITVVMIPPLSAGPDEQRNTMIRLPPDPLLHFVCVWF